MVSQIVTTNGAAHHCRIEGPEGTSAVVFANSLGTDFRIWDAVVADLAKSHRVLRYDNVDTSYRMIPIQNGLWVN